MANNINRVTASGNLTGDPELRTTKNNSNVVRFSIASNKKYKETEEVSYFEVQAWGKLAEIVNKYCQKGKMVFVDGRLKQERWKDQNGQNRSKVIIIAENVQLVGGKSDIEQAKNEMGGQEVDPSDFDEDIPF